MNEQSRRGFLKQTALLAVSLPCVSLLGKTSEASAEEKAPASVPAGETPVSEWDNTAKAVGFHHDAKRTNFSAFPDRKKPSAQNQFCKTCLEYTPLNKSWGRCKVVTAGVVSAQGWCGSWTKKG